MTQEVESSMPTESEIVTVVANCCGVAPEACQLDANIYELGIDSLSLATLIAHCETHLSAEFDDTSIQQLMAAETIGEIVELLRSRASPLL